MRRTLLLAVLCGAAVLVSWQWFAGLLAVDPAEPVPDEDGLTDLLLIGVGVVWFVRFTAEAAGEAVPAARDARAWWRRRRAITTYRIGSAPARPDAAVNQPA